LLRRAGKTAPSAIEKGTFNVLGLGSNESQNPFPGPCIGAYRPFITIILRKAKEHNGKT